MSSTRHAAEGSPFHQEKFCSSPEFERGLLANLVARRCSVLDRPEDADLIWFLQLLSHAPGGLAKVAADLVKRWPSLVATKSMQHFGFDPANPGEIYDAKKVRAVRDNATKTDDNGNTPFAAFGLTGEIYSQQYGRFEKYQPPRPSHDIDWTDPISDPPVFPCEYPVGVFSEVCQTAARKLEDEITHLCLDPAVKLEKFAPWFFPTLVDTLREYQKTWIESRRAGQVVTELGRQVSESLDYCLSSRRMVLIDGLARTGKTFSTKAWCALHPGQARYVQVPSGNDDLGFFKAIAKSLGVSVGRSSKALELRDRVESVLQGGQLALVMDESQFLWPQANRRDNAPGRVSWIMTALVNQGVPVALVTTPQFTRDQKIIEQKTGWASEQFIGRIGHYQKLPDALSKSDLESVARAFLPEGDKESIKALVLYAQGSCRYLAAIESSVSRARFLASKSGREKVTLADVCDAITGGAIPSDNALAAALNPPQKAHGNARRRLVATPLHDHLNRLEIPDIQRRNAPVEPMNLTASTRSGALRPEADQVV